MKQSEIIKYYEENDELRCKGLTIPEIKSMIKAELGYKQRVDKTTCFLLKRIAEIYQK